MRSTLRPPQQRPLLLQYASGLVALALQLGATYVARSFSGDKAQLVPLIKGAMSHSGAAFIDVISPCVTFNNHPTSTKSFDYVRAHNQIMGPLDFVPDHSEIKADYAEGSTVAVELHDGSKLLLHKLDGSHDPRDPDEAISTIRKKAKKGEVATGLLYLDPGETDLHSVLATTKRALNEVPCAELCPGSKVLDGINARFR